MPYAKVLVVPSILVSLGFIVKLGAKLIAPREFVNEEISVVREWENLIFKKNSELILCSIGL